MPPLAQHDSSRLWNVGLLIANLLVFGFTLKLYTEFFKARDARP